MYRLSQLCILTALVQAALMMRQYGAGEGGIWSHQRTEIYCCSPDSYTGVLKISPARE